MLDLTAFQKAIAQLENALRYCNSDFTKQDA